MPPLKVFTKSDQVTVLSRTLAPVLRPTVDLKRDEDSNNYDDQFQQKSAITETSDLSLESLKHLVLLWELARTTSDLVRFGS